MADLADLVLIAGQTILQNGGETFRAEETMLRMAYACGAERAEVFAIPTGIFCTVYQGNYSYSRMVRVRQRGINLGKVLEVNRISRELNRGGISQEHAYSELIALSTQTGGLPILIHSFIGGVASGFSTYLLGGQMATFLVAGFSGFIVMLLGQFLQKIKLVYFVSIALISMVAASINLAAVYFFKGIQFEIAMVGSILALVPGVALTSSMRDALSEDLASASFRGIEAFGVALSIAAGIGSVITLYLSIGGQLMR